MIATIFLICSLFFFLLLPSSFFITTKEIAVYGDGNWRIKRQVQRGEYGSHDQRERGRETEKKEGTGEYVIIDDYR